MNGFDETYATVQFIVIAGIVIFGILIVWSIVSKVSETVSNDASPLEIRDVFVVSKRMEMRGEHTRTYYHATFEEEDGSRSEFQMTGQQYGLLAEGDRGRLTFQGTRFGGFERQIVTR
ncbi:MAG: DUF2500 domain-containing protein [Capsulimonas sp.]|uniref:DUF2500 domain-containing protein n=1 Tax=Capsulimonas sp. TaxID=2494211 RepID=UPI00326544FA